MKEGDESESRAELERVSSREDTQNTLSLFYDPV